MERKEPAIGTPLDEAQPRAEGPRQALKICVGLGAGLIPATCALLFYATLCPFGHANNCREPTNGVDVDHFVGAFVTYFLQVVATIVCLLPRATRPIALGLLIMLVLGPLIAIVGVVYVAMAKTPHADSSGTFLLLPLLVGGIAGHRR